MNGSEAAALVLALGAAFMFGLSNVLEQLEAEQLPAERALRPGFVTDLAHRPRWLAGVGVDVTGYGCHAAALAFGSLVFVQPLLVTGLLFALLLRAAVTGIPLRRGDLPAATLLAAGLAIFLLSVSPHGGHAHAPLARWVIAGPVAAAAVVGCVLAGRALQGPPRALLLGLAAGISFGVSAAMTKSFVHLLGHGVITMLQHWEPYALAVTAVTGFWLMQSSFQAGSLAASVAALEAAEPVVAAAIGIGLLDERIDAHSLGAQLVMALALVAMLAGVIWLARSTTTPRRPRRVPADRERAPRTAESGR